MNRRAFLGGVAAAAALPLTGCDLALREGLFNACHTALPPRLAQHPLVADAWKGIDASQVIDVHCHLFGNGDSGRGIWLNPGMASFAAPAQLVQRLFYLNAGCVRDDPGRVDASVVDRLLNQVEGLKPGAKLMLLAFDWARDERGTPLPERSTFHVPDDYAAAVAKAHPSAFEWAASIHPSDPAAIDRLDLAVAQGARAVKWLPPAQDIDPSSARYDPFYSRMAQLDVPLISHAGDERAIRGHDETLGNPLKLRRALDRGVRVVVAHCASLGVARDLDRGAGGPAVPSFELFARLMDEPAHAGRLFGDLAAVTLGNRAQTVLSTLLARVDWHPRLLNGSDYPLPGVLPLIALDTLAARGMLAAQAVPVLREIRDHNAILFDFVLKRAMRSPSSPTGNRFPAAVFETRRQFATAD
jgi:predicted TIM-barrel fold metal-dependent hydrolase